MASYIDKLEAQAIRAGITKNTEESKKWFQKQMKTIKTPPSRKGLLNDENVKVRARPLPGRMFMYFYDPKHKKTLPYYDRFPLIFMVEKAEGGFYGLNLHYLPPKFRALLFDKLMILTNNKKYDQTTKLRLTYDMLKGASRYRYFKPCFKHYLKDHVASRIVEVPASDWETVLFLPTEQFKKATSSKVWNDSRKQF